MTTPRRLIVAFDPGTYKVGFCVLDPKSLLVLKLGAIEVKGRLHWRLGWIQDKVEQLLREFKGQPGGLDCVVEKGIVWGGNLSTIALAEVRGVLLAAIAKAGARFHEYHASSSKKTVTGKGNAQKPAVVAAVVRILNLLEIPSFDAADAAALAIHHAVIGNPLSLLERSTS